MRNTIIALFILLIVVGLLSPFLNEKTDSYQINEIVKVENVHGDDGSFYTDVYHLVYTDRGVFAVQMKGFNAHPECIGLLKVSDSTRVTLTTRGISVPYFGIYPDIIKVHN